MQGITTWVTQCQQNERPLVGTTEELKSKEESAMW